MAADGNQLIGSIMIFAGNFAPRSWAFCDGQLLSINANQALYSILGTTYGGDGRTTFALPDLRGRAPLGPRTGPGLSTYALGDKGGEEIHTLKLNELPSHNHIAIVSASGGGGTATINATAKLHVSSSNGTTNDPNGNYLAKVPNAGPSQIKMYGSAADIEMNSAAVTVEGTVDLSTIPTPTVTNLDAGGGQFHNNLQPFEAVNYIIALTGLYPSRN